jgi:hypothetical protein
LVLGARKVTKDPGPGTTKDQGRTKDEERGTMDLKSYGSSSGNS